MVKFTRDEVKQFPFTTTTRPPPRYSCYSLFPFRKPVSFHFSSFSFPLLCSGSRSLSNFTLDSAPPFSSPFPRSFGKGFLFFPFSSLLFFTTTAFVQSVNTSNEAFVPFFFASSLFCLVIDEAPFDSASSSSFVFVAHPRRRVRRALQLLCQSRYRVVEKAGGILIPRTLEKKKFRK